MLLTKTVILKWNGASKKWYEERGYIYTKINDEFEVKVEDLQTNSIALVKIICDNPNCKNHITKTIKWQIYKKYVHDDGKYYCNSCAVKLFAKEKIKKTKLLNGKSFYDWCIENNRQDILARWDYELNGCSPKDILYKTNKKFYFKCSRNLHPSELKYISNFTSGKEGSLNCKMCNSFYQWCYDNLSKEKADEIIFRWDYELNKCSPKDINYGTNGKYWFKCPKGIHPSELKRIVDFTGRCDKTMDCKACDSIGQYLIDTYGENGLKDYWDYEKNDVLGLNPFKISKCSSIKIWIKCQEKSYHDSYANSCNKFYRGRRCPYCHGNKIHKYDSLGYLYPEVILIWSKKNKKSPFDYTSNSGQSVWWKCPDGKHEDYKRQINSSNNKNFRCPECSNERTESMLQEKTRLYLESLGYEVLHEYNCSIIPINPKTKHPLPLDNEIKLINDKRLIIEIHGSQHYQEINGKWFDENFDLHKRQLYDRYKRIYVKYMDYEYLEIPYWMDNKEEDYKKLINNKINKMLIKY